MSQAEIQSRLVAAMKRIQQLESLVQQLTSAIRVSAGGDVEIICPGSVKIAPSRQLVLEGGQQGVAIKDSTGNSLTLGMGAVTLTASSKIQLQCSMLSANCGMSQFSGVVKCDTIIAHTVVGSSYTPGAGNLW